MCKCTDMRVPAMQGRRTYVANEKKAPRQADKECQVER